jgi:hypothetical protein
MLLIQIRNSIQWNDLYDVSWSFAILVVGALQLSEVFERAADGVAEMLLLHEVAEALHLAAGAGFASD